LQRVQQSVEGILEKLTALETVWRDKLADTTLQMLSTLPTDRPVGHSDLELLLKEDFEAGLTIIRLFLDRSKDEFTLELKSKFGERHQPSRTAFLRDPSDFLRRVQDTGVLASMNQMISTPMTWEDVITERLKSGRGSAIKGQYRGRALEDFVENIVRKIFDDSYDPRTSFVGKDGKSTAKSDFAIPSKDNPAILIEVKAFGATGSKQTNVIGDVQEIIDQKRHDTTFLVVTDGITRLARKSDLKHLVAFQNTGDIYRIYTSKMNRELYSDLLQLKNEKHL